MGTTRSRRAGRVSWLCVVLLAVLLAACSATRPVVKLGLIAPFEGLYRQTGYEALAAMRAAIAAAETPALGLMPLAMDSGDGAAGVRRTAQKMLADPALRAVVGPFSPQAAEAMADLIDPQAVIWLAPFVGGSAGSRHEALLGLLQAIAAQAGDAQTLVLAGWTPGWPALSEAAWSTALGLPVRLPAGAEEVLAGETVIWLGEAAAGAAYFAQLRSRLPAAPFWLALAGDSPIFYQRAAAHRQALAAESAWGEVYWTAWLDEGFDAWAAAQTPATPTAYAVYRETEAAIAQIQGQTPHRAPGMLYVFQLAADGSSQRTGVSGQ